MISIATGTRDGILYTGAGSRGAVRDYFAQQSDSLFLPEFEVIGPGDIGQADGLLWRKFAIGCQRYPFFRILQRGFGTGHDFGF